MLNAKTYPEGVEMLSAREKSTFAVTFPDAPIDLPSLQVEVPSLDPDVAKKLLPEPLASFSIDVSERLCIPVESAAVLAMGALGGIVGRQIAIKPKRNDDWYEFSNRWAAIVAAPSEKKSATLAEALRPVNKLEERAKREFGECEAENKATQVSLKSQMDASRERMKSAAKDDDAATLKDAERQYAELELKAKDSQIHERRYRTSDATIEKLGELLTQNPNGLLVVRDELSGWISGLERTGREQDRAFYLEAWSGKSSFLVDRIGRPSLHIPALSLTILGTIQPDKLKGLVFEATQGMGGGDGLLQRFQLLVQPDRLRYQGVVDRKPQEGVRESYGSLFESFADLRPEAFGAISSDGGVPKVSFSPEGQDVFYRWLDEHERKLRSGKIESAAFEAHLGKYSGLMPALALLFHLVDVQGGNAPGNDGVSKASAERAADWCRFLEAHAKRVYGLAEHPEQQSAHELLKKIRNGKVKDGIPLREIYRPQWSYLKSSAQVMAAIDVLKEYGWVALEQQTTGGAPSQVIRLHPSLTKVVEE